MHDDFEHAPTGTYLPGPDPEPKPDRRAYRNQPMTREQASDVMIAFALATAAGNVPIRRRMSGDERGYDAIVPMEFVASLPEVKAMLDALDR
jgi:hypothetical protein